MDEELKLKKKEEEQIIEIEIERLEDFKNHPFKVEHDAQMDELIESIRQFGILNPLIIRPMLSGKYEVISGHRRKYAGNYLHYRKVPVIIRVLDDREAVVSMIDSNLQRENNKPSEKAFAYKMKYDAMKRHGKSRKSSQDAHIYKGKRTLQVLAEEYGESPKQIQRYLKLTELIPELLKKMDSGELSLCPAVELAFLKESEQKLFLEAMDYSQASPSLSQAQRIKLLSQKGGLTLNEMKNIMSEIKSNGMDRMVLPNELLYKYFPHSYTPEMMKREIIGLLKLWLEQYNED